MSLCLDFRGWGGGGGTLQRCTVYTDFIPIFSHLYYSRLCFRSLAGCGVTVMASGGRGWSWSSDMPPSGALTRGCTGPASQFLLCVRVHCVCLSLAWYERIRVGAPRDWLSKGPLAPLWLLARACRCGVIRNGVRSPWTTCNAPLCEFFCDGKHTLALHRALGVAIGSIPRTKCAKQCSPRFAPSTALSSRASVSYSRFFRGAFAYRPVLWDVTIITASMAASWEP